MTKSETLQKFIDLLTWQDSNLSLVQMKTLDFLKKDGVVIDTTLIDKLKFVTDYSKGDLQFTLSYKLEPNTADFLGKELSIIEGNKKSEEDYIDDISEVPLFEADLVTTKLNIYELHFEETLTERIDYMNKEIKSLTKQKREIMEKRENKPFFIQFLLNRYYDEKINLIELNEETLKIYINDFNKDKMIFTERNYNEIKNQLKEQLYCVYGTEFKEVHKDLSNERNGK